MNDFQRNEQWHLLRKGKITASQVSVLLGNHKEPMTEEEIAAAKAENPKSRMTTKEMPFSQGSYTYLDSKVAERFMTNAAYLEYLDMFGIENAAMRYGTAMESDAREAYSKAMEYEVEDAPFIELNGYEEIAGGSPDGIVRATNSIVEFKCPANPAIHLRHFLYEKPEDLKEDNEQYYAQCQYNMMCAEFFLGSKVEWCDFVSFDPRTSISKKLKVLRLPADEEYQALLLERTRLAKDYMKEQITKINNISNKIL